MDWIKEVIHDPVLSKLIQWYPTKKYLVKGDNSKQFWDDLECGKKWWKSQVSTHCNDVFTSDIL